MTDHRNRKWVKMQDMKMLDTKIKGMRHNVYLLCIYRMLVHKTVFGVACLVGFVRCFLLFSLRLPRYNEMKIAIIVIANKNAPSQTNNSYYSQRSIFSQWYLYRVAFFT